MSMQQGGQITTLPPSTGVVKNALLTQPGPFLSLLVGIIVVICITVLIALNKVVPTEFTNSLYILLGIGGGTIQTKTGS